MINRRMILKRCFWCSQEQVYKNSQATTTPTFTAPTKKQKNLRKLFTPSTTRCQLLCIRISSSSVQVVRSFSYNDKNDDDDDDDDDCFNLRCAGVIWFLFLIGPLYFDWYVVLWGSKSKHHKDTCLKEIGLRLWTWSIALHLTVKTIGRVMYSVEESTNYALSISITKSGGSPNFNLKFVDVSL